MLFSAYSRYFKPRFLCFFWSSLMTGACHHLRPAAVFYDDRPKAQKAVQYSVFSFFLDSYPFYGYKL